MKHEDVQVGLCYQHKHRVVRLITDLGYDQNYYDFSGRVRRKKHRGWTAINEATGREVRVKSAAGLSYSSRGSKPSMVNKFRFGLSGTFEISTPEQIQTMLACLRTPGIRRFHGKAVDVMGQRRAEQYLGPAVFITEFPQGTPGLELPPYVRICSAEFVPSPTPEEPGHFSTKTHEIWRVPLPLPPEIAEALPEPAPQASC